MEKYSLIYSVYRDPNRKESGTGPQLQRGFSAEGDDDARRKAHTFLDEKGSSCLVHNLYKIVDFSL